jgi:hypothetical protein
LRKSILDDIKTTEKSVLNRIQVMQTDVDGFLDKFTAALKADLSSYSSVKQGISAFLKNLEDIQEAAAITTEVAGQAGLEESVVESSVAEDDGEDGGSASHKEGQDGSNEPSDEAKSGEDGRGMDDTEQD